MNIFFPTRNVRVRNAAQDKESKRPHGPLGSRLSRLWFHVSRRVMDGIDVVGRTMNRVEVENIRVVGFCFGMTVAGDVATDAHEAQNGPYVLDCGLVLVYSDRPFSANNDTCYDFGDDSDDDEGPIDPMPVDELQPSEMRLRVLEGVAAAMETNGQGPHEHVPAWVLGHGVRFTPIVVRGEIAYERFFERDRNAYERTTGLRHPGSCCWTE